VLSWYNWREVSPKFRIKRRSVLESARTSEMLKSKPYANKAHIEGCLTRDATRADVAGVVIMRQMSRYEIGLRPPAPAVGAQGPVGPGPAQRIICKPKKDLKPQELTADMTPVEFAFEAYHAGSHMEVAPIAVQQALFKACVHSVLYNCIKPNIVSGVTPVLGQGNTVMELMGMSFC
jgi:hypothetical protein